MQAATSSTGHLALVTNSQRRQPRSIAGWPLTPLVELDREARGCLADLTIAGALSRQAAFIILGCVDLDNPEDFLARLGIAARGAVGIGRALVTRSARDLIGAAFGVEPAEVPGGFLRALMRVRGSGSNEIGFDALAEPKSYRRLWEILTAEPNSRKAEALRYCGDLCAAKIEAVDLIDPALMHAEILKHLSTPERVKQANAVLTLLRSSISTATDQSLFAGLRASVQGGSSLERYAQKAIEQADRLPDPPLLHADDVQPLTTAQALIAFGAEMKNCSRTKISEVVLGMSYIYRVEHRGIDGTLTILAVSLSPLSDGRWMVCEIKGVKNRRPDTSVLRAVVRRLHTLGAVSPESAVGKRTKALSEVLGVYRWNMPDLGDLEEDKPTDDTEAA